MKYIVISGAIIYAMETKYGREVVEKCFDLANEKLPKEVYEDIKDSGDQDLINCFCTIYEELLK